ncbi:MAG TPA: MoaD/ThiS family protein [Gemmatimonadota bacterium]|nr:MoaD/ThiS family protein [Gemmatimonadota bacterium]
MKYSRLAMPHVTIEIPRILQDSAGGRTRLELEAENLAAAAGELRRKWPVLATHVFTETGALRSHVLLLHNDQLTLWGNADVRLRPGDRLEILQAVSGG